MPTLNVTMPNLHDGQREVADHPARFKVLVTGRRWGKTRLGSLMCLDVALNGGRAWWVAPSYPMATVGWRGIKHLAKQRPGMAAREVDRLIELPGGGSIQVRSADNPDSLRGEGLDFLVIDEAAFVREEAWTEALRPALSDRQGRALIISTPKGRNWFWRAYQRGVSGDPEWHAWQLPTVSNPYIDPAEVEAARGLLPTDTFRQEYLAAFLDDAGLVFRNVRGCLAQPPPGPQGGRRYVMGVDWAQAHDWTVLTVMDVKDRQVVEIDRFNQIEWAFQRSRLVAMCQRWGVRYVLAEHNSIGGPNIEALNRDPEMSEVTVIGFETTNPSKTAAVQALMLAFERGEIAIPEDPVLLAELEAFEAKRLPSGKWQYGAPGGMHDDTVISLMLAYRAALSGGVELVSQPTHASAFAGMGDDWSGEGSRWKRW